eukprot:ctg_2359.g437
MVLVTVTVRASSLRQPTTRCNLHARPPCLCPPGDRRRRWHADSRPSRGRRRFSATWCRASETERERMPPEDAEAVSDLEERVAGHCRASSSTSVTPRQSPLKRRSETVWLDVSGDGLADSLHSAQRLRKEHAARLSSERDRWSRSATPSSDQSGRATPPDAGGSGRVSPLADGTVIDNDWRDPTHGTAEQLPLLGEGWQMTEAAPRSSLGTRLRGLLHRLDAFLDARSERLSRTHVHAQLEHALGALHTSGQIGEHPSNRTAGDGYGAVESTMPSAPPGEAASAGISLPPPHRRLSTAALAASATHPASYCWRLPFDLFPHHRVRRAAVRAPTGGDARQRGGRCRLSYGAGAVGVCDVRGAVGRRRRLRHPGDQVHPARHAHPQPAQRTHPDRQSGRAGAGIRQRAQHRPFGSILPHGGVCGGAAGEERPLPGAVAEPSPLPDGLLGGGRRWHGRHVWSALRRGHVLARAHGPHLPGALSVGGAVDGLERVRRVAGAVALEFLLLLRRRDRRHRRCDQRTAGHLGVVGACRVRERSGPDVRYAGRTVQSSCRRAGALAGATLPAHTIPFLAGADGGARRQRGSDRAGRHGRCATTRRRQSDVYRRRHVAVDALEHGCRRPVPFCALQGDGHRVCHHPAAPVRRLPASVRAGCGARARLPMAAAAVAAILRSRSVGGERGDDRLGGICQRRHPDGVGVARGAGTDRQPAAAVATGHGQRGGICGHAPPHRQPVCASDAAARRDAVPAVGDVGVDDDGRGGVGRGRADVADTAHRGRCDGHPCADRHSGQHGAPGAAVAAADGRATAGGVLVLGRLAAAAPLLDADQHDEQQQQQQQQQRWPVRLDDPIPLLRDRGVAQAHVDVAPPTIPANAPLSKLDAFFSVLGAAHVLVLAPTALGDVDDAVAGNVPVGIVYKEALLV